MIQNKVYFCVALSYFLSIIFFLPKILFWSITLKHRPLERSNAGVRQGALYLVVRAVCRVQLQGFTEELLLPHQTQSFREMLLSCRTNRQ